MPRVPRKTASYLIKLRRAVALLEPKIDVDTVFAMNKDQLADVLLHYALHMDAQRERKKHAEDDGTNGQDRKSYSDDQDRESYSV